LADEENINARNTELAKITEERSQVEENTTQYRAVQRARDNLLTSIQESVMTAAKTPDKNFLIRGR
jgi:hypothetical protein